MKIYGLVTLKRKLEELIMAPFVWNGRSWADKHPLPEEYDLFCFFPIYGLGGAEKVNADVLECLPDKKIVVFFTRKSHETTMLHLFQRPNVTIHDISKWTDNKLRYWDNLFYRGVCARYINKQYKRPRVFNGQCNFAYKLFPHLHKDILKVELIHNTDKHFAWIVYPYVPFINKRILVADQHIKDYSSYYNRIGIPEIYKKRMQKVLYKIEPVDGSGPRASYGERINFYYAGRGGSQKRVWLIVKAIQEINKRKLPVNFHLAGNFKDELPDDVLSLCTFHGTINGGKEMMSFHQKMDVLMMTSAYEGFPVVIMEAMINGAVPVATAVDGVPEHIKNGENGLLIHNAADEEGVVQQLVKHIEYICQNRDHLQNMSSAAYSYARDSFSREKFCHSYREVLEL